MNAWERSWSITRTTFGIIREDKEMLAFPILAGVFSILYSVALIVPSFVLHAAGHVAGASRSEIEPFQVAILFATYFGLSFIATFFNVCVVYTTRTRLLGGDATFRESLSFAASKFHLIFAWSLVAAAVGLLLRALDKVAEGKSAAAQFLWSILRSLLATAWSIMTLFVVPAMVYRDLGPIDAIGESLSVLNKTWGESLVRHYGMGFAMGVCLVPAVALIFAGVVAMQAPVIGIPLLAIGILATFGVILVFGVANTVFNTVLYHYSTEGSAPGFDNEVLAGMFSPKE